MDSWDKIKMAQNYGLGRGLASLIPQKNKKIDKPDEDFNYFGTTASKNAGPFNDKIQNQDGNVSSGGSFSVNISQIIPNPHQPRIKFDEEKLQELAASVKEHGIIQPITVSKSGNQYEIIAGERRFQAAKIAGLKEVPVIVREVTEQQKLELAVIENIQRHDLNPVEEAKSYKKLMEEFDMSQEEIAVKLSKNRSSVANKLRLLNLPVEIQRSLIEGKITEGHAKAILAIENPEKQRALYEMILKNNWTVRQAENKTKEVSVRTHKRNVAVDPEIKQKEEEISQKLGTKAKISRSGGGGRIVIDYYSKEELDNIISKIL